MRRLILTAPRELRWEEAPAPTLEADGDALVRPVAVAACDIDPVMVAGIGVEQYPVALGHECVGEVVEAGPAVREFAPGDLVAVPYQLSCGACEHCRRGFTTSCTATPHRATYGFGRQGGDFGGALADLLHVPHADAMLVALPAGVDAAAVASVGDNLSSAWEAVALGLERWPGAEVLVLGLDLPGAGASIGLYAAALAPALGASATRYLDADPARLELARRLGAEPVEGPPPRRAGSYPVVVDASGSVAGLQCAVRSTGPSGVCTSVSGAVHFGETPMPLRGMYDRYCTFHTGRASVRPAMPRVLELVAAGRLRPELVVTATASWDEAPDALLEPHTKLVVSRPRG